MGLTKTLLLALTVSLPCFDLAVLASSDTNGLYEYVVVGSGPGGGILACNLAIAGYSTLLLEAGDDESADITTKVAALSNRNAGNRTYAANTAWDFFVKNYDDLNLTLQHNHLTWQLRDGSYWVGNGEDAPANATLLGVYYPRGATLGGSAIVNAMVTYLPPDSDWDYIANLTGDASWNHTNMRSIFERIEKNHYLADPTPGHGFNGFLDTNLGNEEVYKKNPDVLTVLSTMAEEAGLDPTQTISYVEKDPNYVGPQRDVAQGLWGMVFHVTKNRKRFSPRDVVLATVNAKNEDGSKKYPLDVSLNSLVTKIDFDNYVPGTKPSVRSVNWLEGKSVYKGDSRFNASVKGAERFAYVGKELIISGGTFNTPQILQLSGIGPRQELEKLGIDVIADLPGVGRNLQDNQELPVIGHAQENFTAISNPNAPTCTYGATDDPCLQLWYNGTGPYTESSSNANILLLKTNHSTDGEHDIFLFSGNFAFRGFWLPRAYNPNDPPSTFGMSMVKIHPQNKAGYVKLRSADPTDTPEINFNLYQEGATTDLNAMAEAVAFGRRAHRAVPAPLGPIDSAEPPCPDGVAPTGGCGERDRQWIRAQTFGHHPTSSCAIGADGDPMAVLDSRFRVRGVERLRVVDASVFPRVPGAFPVVATFMVSQKASDVILEDAEHFP